MTLIQDKLRELNHYNAPGKCPEDFEAFWIKNLEDDHPESARLILQAIPYPLAQVEVFKAIVKAGDGVDLKGYYLRPVSEKITASIQGPKGERVGTASGIPGLVRYHGYSGNRGQISELLLWALQGYAILGLDIRGQCGETSDGRVYPAGGFSGWMTLGLDAPENHYLRQVYLDIVRVVEALGNQPEINEKRIGVLGKSQGGGLSIVAAGLINKLGSELGLKARVKAVSAAIPFLADFRGAYKLYSDGPIAELSWYFRLFDPEHKREEEVFRVLDYFDAIHFAPWIGERSQCLVSIGLKDTACPPPTIYALYQALKGRKKLLVYPEYGHESPDEFVDRQIEFFVESLYQGE